MPRRSRIALLAQGIYYLATGLWSLVDIESFERITGPKMDRWLVKTVGTLLVIDGAVMTLAVRRERVTPEVALLGLGTALGVAAIDVVYALRGRISPVYLLDAAAEIVLASGVGTAAREVSQERQRAESRK
ncbi:MAG TPA: hypothetical protein VF166_01605 [Gemmatimonadaceae bacterium]